MDFEDSLRKHVQALKAFYTNLVIYAVVCVACIIIWISMGGGPFWPIWVIFGFGLGAILQGASLGQIPKVHEFLPFLNPAWEEEQVQALLEKTGSERQRPKPSAPEEEPHPQKKNKK